MSDIRVDRYDENVSGTSGTIAIADIEDTTRAFLRITGSSRQDSAGPNGSTSHASPDTAGVRLRITGTDEVTYYKALASEVKVMFEVWTYTGRAGGPYEFISRQRGSVDLGTATTGVASVSGLSNRNDCVPFYNGFQSGESNNSSFNQCVASCHLNSASEVVFERGEGGSSLECSYDVVEFSGSGWSVGTARSSNHDTGNDAFSAGDIVTMNTDSDGASGSTFDVTNWSTAMIVQGTMEGDPSEAGISDTMMYFLPGPSSTQLHCALDNSNSRNLGVAYAYVLQCDDMVVTRDTASGLPEGNSSYGTNLTAPAGHSYSAPLSSIALEWFPGSSGEGTAHSRGALHATLTDTGSAHEVRHWIHRSGNVVKAAFGLADFSLLGSPAFKRRRLNGSLVNSSRIRHV